MGGTVGRDARQGMTTASRHGPAPTAFDTAAFGVAVKERIVSVSRAPRRWGGYVHTCRHVSPVSAKPPEPHPLP